MAIAVQSIFAAALFSFIGPARAGPVGEPASARDVVDCCEVEATIDPLAAAPVDPAATSSLLRGLGAQDFRPPDWQVVSRPLAGMLNITLYYAWVDQFPAPACGGLSVPDPEPGTHARGGAVFCLTYAPGAGDPTGEDVHWVQSVETNFDPQQPGEVFDAASGMWFFLDNDGDPRNPFYDTHGTANATNFLDTPFRDCSSSSLEQSFRVRFNTFLATFAADDTPTIGILSEGLNWGYDLECHALIASIPESTSLALLGTGLLGLGLARRPRA
ncbi:MAG: PEP-CTERM sorting domain-containing protein [Acidisphaera sp.]|nr:PEP-CTERM sorting domain-containing protein [Acidisphaera sp.]